MWLMFNKMAEICVPILDDRPFFCVCFYRNIYEMRPDIFEIFRTFSRYLGKNREFPQTYLGNFS